MNNQTNKIILASNNQGKLAEFKDLLKTFSLDIVTIKDFNLAEVEETGLSFVENAILKARYAASATDLPAIADDSGLIVDYLNGAPGIYSARFAGVNANAKENNTKLLKALENVPQANRSARFYCVIVFMRHAKDPTPIICQGTWEGVILTKPQGEQGFGYDPIFYVPMHKCSAAELSLDIKNQISHRAQAFIHLSKYFQAKFRVIK